MNANLKARREQFQIGQRSRLHSGTMAYRPMTQISDVQPDDSDPPLGWMLVWAVIAIPCWALFGWGVVGLIRFFGGSA